MKSLDLALVMPVFNEEGIIEKVISDWLKVSKNIKSIIILVDDGSTDNTFNIIKNIKNKRIKIIRQKNSGHGPAILTGYKYAIKTNAKYIFQTDTDNQFFTSDFKKFWKMREKFDLILGYRKIRYDDKIRLVITRILRLILNIFFGIRIKDSNIPYRLMNKKFLDYSLKNFNLKTNIVNIFLSIIGSKKFKITTLKVKHKKRLTGKVWIVSFGLLKFCIISFINLIKLRLTI
jgi:dolichol-phosphate mannosyltransferase